MNTHQRAVLQGFFTGGLGGIAGSLGVNFAPWWVLPIVGLCLIPFLWHALMVTEVPERGS